MKLTETQSQLIRSLEGKLQSCEMEIIELTEEIDRRRTPKQGAMIVDPDVPALEKKLKKKIAEKQVLQQNLMTIAIGRDEQSV